MGNIASAIVNQVNEEMDSNKEMMHKNKVVLRRKL